MTGDILTEDFLAEEPPFPPDEEPEVQVDLKSALFVEIAMDSPGLQEGLTYAVPPDLVDDIQPGQLVWGPLKKGRAQGVVMSVGKVAPPFRVRPISDLVDRRPVLQLYQLGLARWLASYYYCGLFEAVSLMLPPGFSKVARPTLTVTPA